MCVNIIGDFYVLGSSSSRDRNSLLEQVCRLESQLNELHSQVVPPIPHVLALRAEQLEASGRGKNVLSSGATPFSIPGDSRHPPGGHQACKTGQTQAWHISR